MKHKFAKPYNFNGKEYTELEIDIENITTLDYEKAESQYKTINPGFSGLIEAETGFTKQLIINATKLPAEFYNGLPLGEFIKLKYAVQGFLLGSIGLTSSEQPA
jgi:hypothetical protein